MPAVVRDSESRANRHTSSAGIPADIRFAQELDAMAWTASAWKNANRAHSPTNVTVKDGVLALKSSASAPGTKPVCAEVVHGGMIFFMGRTAPPSR